MSQSRIAIKVKIITPPCKCRNSKPTFQCTPAIYNPAIRNKFRIDKVSTPEIKPFVFCFRLTNGNARIAKTYNAVASMPSQPFLILTLKSIPAIISSFDSVSYPRLFQIPFERFA